MESSIDSEKNELIIRPENFFLEIINKKKKSFPQGFSVSTLQTQEYNDGRGCRTFDWESLIKRIGINKRMNKNETIFYSHLSTVRIVCT